MFYKFLYGRNIFDKHDRCFNKVIITLWNLTGLVLIIIVLPELNRIIFIMISTHTPV
jgi:hypothetical protein